METKTINPDSDRSRVEQIEEDFRRLIPQNDQGSISQHPFSPSKSLAQPPIHKRVSAKTTHYLNGQAVSLSR